MNLQFWSELSYRHIYCEHSQSYNDFLETFKLWLFKIEAWEHVNGGITWYLLYPGLLGPFVIFGPILTMYLIKKIWTICDNKYIVGFVLT